MGSNRAIGVATVPGQQVTAQAWGMLLWNACSVSEVWARDGTQRAPASGDAISGVAKIRGGAFTTESRRQRSLLS